MNRKLKEELKKIHRLNYKSLLSEDDNFFQKLFKKSKTNKKVDEPKKSDYLTGKVAELYEVLEFAAEKGGIEQQRSGSYVYQIAVEALQIGLEFLGYDLPRFGIDGKFGPETADAVRKFQKDNSIDDKTKSPSKLDEMVMVQLSDTSYSNIKYDNDATRNDEVNKALLDDLQKAAEAVDVVATITTAKSGHRVRTISGNISRHTTQTAVDIAILDGMGSNNATNSSNGNPKFRELGNRLKDALVKLGYVWNSESGNPKAVLWQTNTGGNHYNHLHVSNNSGASKAELDKLSLSSNGSEDELLVATPETINKMIDLLKSKNLKDEDIKPFVDKSMSSVLTKIDINDFQSVTNQIIDKLEGGYYHPSMSVGDSRFRLYGNSGETMMGMDRKAGAGLASKPLMKEFWGLIDDANADKSWPWNYKGGPLEKKLRSLVAETMKQQFAEYVNRYLSPEAKKIVLSDKKLFFNFAYATWNGPGFFQDFAQDINQEVKNGETDPAELIKVAMDSRLSSNSELVRKSGDKLTKILAV